MIAFKYLGVRDPESRGSRLEDAMRKSLLRTITCLVVFSLLGCYAPCQARCHYKFPQDCNPTDITDKDICNFHKVDADLYRGARPRCSGYVKLANMGIQTIVSL